MDRRRLIPPLLLCLALAPSCDDGGKPRPEPEKLTAEVVGLLETALQAEFLAQQTAFLATEDFGGESAAAFEPLHDDANRRTAELARLFTAYELTVPASDWNVTNVPRFADAEAARRGLLEQEFARRKLYDELLAQPELPADVAWTWKRLRRLIDEERLPLLEGTASENTNAD